MGLMSFGLGIIMDSTFFSKFILPAVPLSSPTVVNVEKAEEVEEGKQSSLSKWEAACVYRRMTSLASSNHS